MNCAILQKNTYKTYVFGAFKDILSVYTYYGFQWAVFDKKFKSIFGLATPPPLLIPPLPFYAFFQDNQPPFLSRPPLLLYIREYMFIRIGTNFSILYLIDCSDK